MRGIDSSLLRQGAPVHQRPMLEPRQKDGLTCWEFVPPAPQAD